MTIATADILRKKLEAAGLLPMEAQAQMSTRILKRKLATVLPQAMEETGIDLWLVIGRENGEDPLMKTLMTWDMPQARRITALAFHYDKASKRVEAMSIGKQSPVMDEIYRDVRNPGETVMESIGRLVHALQPNKLGINRSELFGCCDGISATLQEELLRALPPEDVCKVTAAQALAIRWLEGVCDIELELCKTLVEITEDIVHAVFSSPVVREGITTTRLEWAMREIIFSIGCTPWFGPDVDLQRKGAASSRLGDIAIQKGDLLHCDIGIAPTYVRLHTDIQRMAYVCRDTEAHAPQPFLSLLKEGNRFQQIVMDSFKEGLSGNEIFFASMDKAKKEGIPAMLYTHPLGTFGHGAGPTVGQYDNQGYVPGSGELPLQANSCFALELNVYRSLPLWENQAVFMYLEEDIAFTNHPYFLSKQQTELIEIIHSEE